MHCVDRIIELFETRGAEAYLGESVSQREHALQATYLATRENSCDALVAATLLHDIGHLLAPDERAAERGVDQFHQDLAFAWLSSHFGPEITEPIRLHVIAKRYLCAVEPSYLETLSAASIVSLELQGGPLTADEIARFQADPHHRDAVKLRRWDDQAKVPGWEVPDLALYVTLLKALSKSA
jgi:[1-hydroxy-2-(trimethylamino)ethyl]phosphonate dioxygenase